MVNLKETARQFIMSSILGVVTKVLSIFLSNFLDKYINHNISNFIGLTVNAGLDFFMMKKVFRVEKEESSQFITRYTISIVLSVITAQILYMSFSSYMRKYHQKWVNEKWDKYVFWIRYVAGAFAYGFVEFPLHKFWVFKK
jgi:putative flippase GtrA